MRERVEGLGGELSVESAPSKGTAVVLNIPVQDIPSAPNEATDATR